MCCFTGPVRSVSNTKIFARPGKGHQQFLVYRMSMEANNSVAMVLPLPVKPGSGEDAVKFIDLKEYPSFFEDVESGFPQEAVVTDSHNRSAGPPQPQSAAILEVVQVGDFEASFVPTVRDFSRLDKRFRLPDSASTEGSARLQAGFRVLRFSNLNPEKQDVHPMAFWFPRRDASLFYPTVHIHEGKVQARAAFDHILYGQPATDTDFIFHGWAESTSHAQNFVKIEKTKGVVGPHLHCYKKALTGTLKNQDTVIANAA